MAVPSEIHEQKYISLATSEKAALPFILRSGLRQDHRSGIPGNGAHSAAGRISAGAPPHQSEVLARPDFVLVAQYRCLPGNHTYADALSHLAAKDSKCCGAVQVG